MFDNDYIIRQISLLARGLAKVMFQKETATVEIIDEDGIISGEGFFYHRLMNLAEAGKINDAENELFSLLQEEPTQELLRIAIIFYSDLDKLSDTRLAECSYSRAEILEGLQAVQKAD